MRGFIYDKQNRKSSDKFRPFLYLCVCVCVCVCVLGLLLKYSLFIQNHESHSSSYAVSELVLA